jgi:hypothetical protein
LLLLGSVLYLWFARHLAEAANPIAFPCSSHGDPMLRCYGDSKGWNTALVSYLTATSATGDGPSRDRKKDRLAVSRYSSSDVPDTRGLTMECMCMACGGSGFTQHVDRTLPPPPCRVCRPDEAALHMALAHQTRMVAAARRREAYQMLRATIALGAILLLPGCADGVARRGASRAPTTREGVQAYGPCSDARERP